LKKREYCFYSKLLTVSLWFNGWCCTRLSSQLTIILETSLTKGVTTLADEFEQHTPADTRHIVAFCQLRLYAQLSDSVLYLER